MVWFAPSSKPVTLAPFKGRCQIRSELIHFMANQMSAPPFLPHINAKLLTVPRRIQLSAIPSMGLSARALRSPSA